MLHSIIKRTPILLVCFLFLQSCSVKTGDVDYFPLENGLQWKYKMVTEYSEQARPIKKWFSMKNLGQQTIVNGKQTFDAYVRRTSDGTDYYLTKDGTGLHRVAKRTVVEIKPRFDEIWRKVLPVNKELLVDALWNVETGLYLMHSSPEYDVDLSEKRLNMLFEIKSTDAIVEVPAGVFENCIEIEGYASITLYADARIGYIQVPVIQREWYAPGVGLVKMVRTEEIESSVYNGGELSFELSEFDS